MYQRVSEKSVGYVVFVLPISGVGGADLKVDGNEKQCRSGRSQMLDNGLGPWRSRFIFNLNMQFLS
jgi:hypothetical protein